MERVYFVFTLVFMITTLLSGQDTATKNTNCDSLEISKITTGIMFAINGRSIEKLPVPKVVDCGLGNFSFKMQVNRNGNIVDTEFLDNKSASLSDIQLKELLTVIELVKFSQNDKAPKIQEGMITYVFDRKD